MGVFIKRVCIFVLLLCSQAHAWRYIDFDVAMQRAAFPRSIAFTQHIVGIDGNLFLDFCKQLYNLYNPSNRVTDLSLRIPKVIHQIWIGGPVPVAFKPYMESWVQLHMGPEWQYKLWTDEDVKTFNLYNQHFYDISENPGIRSDLLKWEIIYRYGGVYVDVDFEALSALDELHYMYDFYTALQPLDTQYAQLGAALFAAHPLHPILKHCIETVKDDWDKQGVPAKTGPIHFTKSFYLMAGANGSVDIAFPAYYFYPLGCTQMELKRQEWIANGAYAIHHWAKSWMPAKYRLTEFKKLNNDKEVAGWND
jgi:mannosyltransferase OCH1-like enzyme